MLPLLNPKQSTQTHYIQFIDTLKEHGFTGDIELEYGSRIALATDNSLYQVLPQGILYPKQTQDIELLAQLVQEERFTDIVLTPRGGGTGTNGQSLTNGLMVDLSRHMNHILEINVEERWVRVQTGVVKDQLNAFLKPHGLFFAPELSTSNRATIGGMINTDASGQGSCLYGKTRDHVLELESVWLDGTRWHSKPIHSTELESLKERKDKIGQIHQWVDTIHKTQKDLIQARFPTLNRCLTGYDLAHIYNEQGGFNLNSILCGSEGTLAFITEAKLNVLPIPKYSALVNVSYDSFDAALRDAQQLMQAKPTSIETIDSKVLNLAKNDYIWSSVSEYFPESADKTIQGINLVEYTADSEDELNTNLQRLCQQLDTELQNQNTKVIAYTLAEGDQAVKAIWAMRKRAVGLLGNAKGSARPVPFVEDTAVPPENLADFIAEFRATLDKYKLSYGMFGHVDAGVLHVRPALDMKLPESERLIRQITDEVVALTLKYKGLLWGEHGKGVRSEYAPELFGETLYTCLQQIKAAFDPHNQLNPGKICTPLNTEQTLLKIDEVPMRGQVDRLIPQPIYQQLDSAMHCNGNGACFNYDANDPMCPSWKGTRQRIHSPKGRASLIREWSRLLGEHHKEIPTQSSLWSRWQNTRKKQQGEYDFSHEVLEAMSGCLACKSCSSQCPIKVDVPTFRAQFLESYYSRYLRPTKDYMIGSLEHMLPWVSMFPKTYNTLLSNKLSTKLMQNWLGVVDSPKLSTDTLKTWLKQNNIPQAKPQELSKLSDTEKSQSVILIQDAFTSHFESQLVFDVIKLLQTLAIKVYVAPFHANGKPLQVHGFLSAFKKVAKQQTQHLQRLANTGIPLIGIEPPITLTYRQEYVKTLPDTDIPKVWLLQEWLSQQSFSQRQKASSDQTFKLLGHCTEKTSEPNAVKDWQSLFQQLGLNLEEIKTGCCGMAGTYGHEAKNIDTSKTIYDLSWAKAIHQSENPQQLLATGYSCRSQVKRFDNVQLMHPAQALLKHLTH